jgi:uncharacterized membrane protein
MGDNYKDIANKIGKDSAEKKLVEEGLKAACEGRDTDMYRSIDRLMDKRKSEDKSSSGAVWGWAIGLGIVGVLIFDFGGLILGAIIGAFIGYFVSKK